MCKGPEKKYVAFKEVKCGWLGCKMERLEDSRVTWLRGGGQ